MRKIICLLAGIATLALVGVASAHSVLRRSSPAEGATLAQVPSEVRLTFNDAVEPRFSTIDVRGPDGRLVSGAVRADKQNEIAVGIASGSPGRYDVHWRVMSVDAHKVQGQFQFRVAP